MTKNEEMFIDIHTALMADNIGQDSLSNNSTLFSDTKDSFIVFELPKCSLMIKDGVYVLYSSKFNSMDYVDFKYKDINTVVVMCDALLNEK